MATTRLTRTFSGNGDRQKFTFSAWIKRCTTSQSFLWTSGSYSSSSMTQWLFDSDGTLGLYDYNSSGSVLSNVVTNRVFRDTSAWYHIVIRVDTTQSTAADRIRIYVNGVQETSFSAANYPGQNNNYIYSESITAQYFGQRADQGNTSSFDGLMSHIHWTDGYSYDASSFGETDSTTGEWKIITSPSVTYGTNGYFILKDGNSVTDQSGNSNNFTVANGTLTDLKDNPSHNFCNINGLYNQTLGQGVTINNCGNTVYYASDSSRSCFGSIAPSSGKYYFECKVFSNSLLVVGIVNMAWSNLNSASGYGYHDDALNFGYNHNGEKTSGGTNTSFGTAPSNNDIIQVAMDLDNSKLYFGLNGTWQNSGDPTSGSTGTGSAFNLASGANYTAACRLRNGTQLGFNFGNGQFSGSSVVSSEGTNASGHGKFEYDVPTGYTALSTKGLNE